MSKNKVNCVDVEGKSHSVDVKNLKFRPAVYGVIIKDNKILLSKQWDGYDFPGGAIELGETNEEALKREVFEETGFEINIGKLITCETSFFKIPFTEKFVHSILIYYLCEIVGGEISIENLDGDEGKFINEPEWINLTEIKKVKHYSSVDNIKIINKAINLL